MKRGTVHSLIVTSTSIQLSKTAITYIKCSEPTWPIEEFLIILTICEEKETSCTQIGY